MKNSSQKNALCDVRLRFYVAGDGIFSRQAKANLEELVKDMGHEIEAEVIDVMKVPETALSEGIFTTPTLVVLQGDASFRFVGDLSDRELVIAALQR